MSKVRARPHPEVSVLGAGPHPEVDPRSGAWLRRGAARTVRDEPTVSTGGARSAGLKTAGGTSASLRRLTNR